jgi:BASS family bile acid:Na+ symporter
MNTLQLLMPVITASLVLIMFGLGASLSIDAFRRMMRQPHPVLLGLLCQLLLLPLAGVFLIRFAPLPAPALVGLAVIASCPGGSLSNLFSHLSRSDTALSVTLTALSTGVAALTLPFWLRLALAQIDAPAGVPHIPLGATILQVLLTTVVPVLAGVAFQHRYPGPARRFDRPVRIFALSFLVIVVAGTLFKSPETLLDHWDTLLPVAFLFNAGTMLLGYAAARLARLRPVQARTILLETGIQNVPLALTITTVTLQSLEAGLFPTLYGAAMMVTGSIVMLFSVFWRGNFSG